MALSVTCRDAAILLPVNLGTDSVCSHKRQIRAMCALRLSSTVGDCYAEATIATEFTLSGTWQRRKLRP
jgi:hypothetical protein